MLSSNKAMSLNLWASASKKQCARSRNTFTNKEKANYPEKFMLPNIANVTDKH